MEQLPGLGRNLPGIIGPTLGAYKPLLLKNANEIRSVQKATYSYGHLERQQLDVYSAPEPAIRDGRHPVMVFLYGGGLVQGHRTLPGYAEDLCHANIAAFFALRCGYSTVVVDYRLVNSHDAVFPSGGEDLALALEYLVANSGRALGSARLDLFVMGNSAGGVHLATFLLHPSFAENRDRLLSGQDSRLRGVILLSVPFHFRNVHPSRNEVLEAYFGPTDLNWPLGLLRSARENEAIDFLGKDLRLLVLNGELDPEDEMLGSRDDFIREWMLVDGAESCTALAVDMMVGHNHISPFCSLGTSFEREEAWGYQVNAFCENARKFSDKV